jgi:acetyl/propionyl-CoA carboxylase alpha subunit
MKISKLLVANRGEIAVRVFRTCRSLGIKTVAVFSEADQDAMHVALADEAVFIGGSMPSESYLRIEAIIDACRQTGANAVHPGYGFLSERAEFSEALAEAGILFLGPPASAMRQLGGKIDAKTLAVQSQVPITPGFFEAGASEAKLKAAAKDIGYPVMLKASAGGGGRGMRIVRSEADFENELSIAKDEALKGFGDDAMMVEKLIENPRHIEVQFIADQHGNVACLYERECSIQRRHQKLIEEAPSPLAQDDSNRGWVLDWDGMRDATTRLAKRAGYFGAGTAEFMVDPGSGDFYFLEVNARLQVEHPVTEGITGLDLVALQIAVAEGEPLDIPFDQLQGQRTGINGHAIEVRIVAEDPAQGFLPSIGKIIGWAEPRHPGVRLDTGFSQGSEITRFYDSMIAKVIAHGKDREETRKKLVQALLDFHVIGVKTNIGYLLEVLEHPEFIRGNIDTGFLSREFAEWKPEGIPLELGAIARSAQSPISGAKAAQTDRSVWALADGWRVAKA